ncbi:MAG: hypothetical protein AAGU19_01395 [Prolixibacteraceae bacterium]
MKPQSLLTIGLLARLSAGFFFLCTAKTIKTFINKIYLMFVLLLVIPFISCSKNIDSVPTDNPGNNGDDNIECTLTPPQIKPLPVVLKEEWELGSTTPGDNTQHMLGLAYCEAAPDRIYMAQDVCNVWVSRDFGKNWFSLRNEGLHSPFIAAVEVDPLDKNRVLAVAHCRNYDAVNRPYQGIYLSADGGITWQRKVAREQVTEVRSSTKLLAYAPTSRDQQKGYATQWYAAFCEGDDLASDDGLLTSDDGGVTWSEIRKLPASTYGTTIRGIKVHKTDPDKVFLYSNNGLFRFEDATDPDGEVTRLSGQTGLPEGDIWGSLYQSDDGQVLIVAVAQQGIYKSTNGAANWSLLYGWNEINYCYVGEKHPDMIFAVPREKSGEQIRVSHDGGATWYSPPKSDVHYRPGYDNNDWNTKLNGQFSYVLSDPRDWNKVFIHTKSKNFRSEDGGLTWGVSDDGFNGTSHIGKEMFDPANPDRFCYAMTDRGLQYTDSRGRWFYKNTIVPNELGLAWKTCYACALHPTLPVILAVAGSGSVGTLLRSPDNGQTWSVVSAGNKQRWVLAFDLENPNYSYQWRERSSDAGVTWTEMPNMPDNSILCGISRSNGKVLYAKQAKKIWRSTDRGDTWLEVFEAGWDLTMPGDDATFVFQVHPQDPNIVFTSSANGHITKWDVSTLPARPADMTITGSTDAGFFIKRFAIDPRHPKVMYAINLRSNTGNYFFRTIDGGVTWENISRYFSQGDAKGLAVSPVTGEVYISSQNGSLVMLPPYPTGNTAYEAVPYVHNHLTELYD